MERQPLGAGPEPTGTEQINTGEQLELFDRPDAPAVSEAIGGAALRSSVEPGSPTERPSALQQEPSPTAVPHPVVRGRRLEASCLGPVELIWRPRQQDEGGIIELGGGDER